MTAFAQADKNGFSLNGDGEYVLEQVTDNYDHYSLSSYYNNRPVAAIAPGAFSSCKDAKWYFIPRSIKEIGDHGIGYFFDGTNYNKQNDVIIFAEGKDTAAWKYAVDNGFEVQLYKENVLSIINDVLPDNIGNVLDDRGIYNVPVYEKNDDEPFAVKFFRTRRKTELLEKGDLVMGINRLETYASKHNDLLYSDDGDSVAVVGLTEEKTSYVIPEMIGGKPVTSIEPIYSSTECELYRAEGFRRSSECKDDEFMFAFKKNTDIEEYKVILPMNCTSPLFSRESDIDAGEKQVNSPSMSFSNIYDEQDRTRCWFFYRSGSEAEKKVLELEEHSYYRSLFTEFKFGDVDLNGIVNVSDVSLAAAYIKSIRSLDDGGSYAADTNEDQAVSVTDVSRIAALVKGIRNIK